MHFLYLYTDYFKNEDIPLTLHALQHSFDILDTAFMTDTQNPAQLDALSGQLQCLHYDAVISFGYVPYISDLCNAMEVFYVSWTYDSILHSLYNESLENPYNILFVYDAAEYAYLSSHFQVPHLYYLPLAANLDRIRTLSLTEASASFYTCDISFVGDLYQQNTYVDLKPQLSLAERDYFEQAFAYFFGRWGADSIYDWFSIQDADFLQERLPDYLKNDGLLPNRRYFADILLSKPIGSRERIALLNHMAKHYPVRLYTKPSADTSVLSGVDCRPYLNYYDAMYLAFHYSRVNLNLTLHGMESGIPLRCYDVMAAGGFLLTNYQPEMEELFTIGTDLVCYKSLEEAVELAGYYLHHEAERTAIARAGLASIEACHTYTHRIRFLCDTLQKILAD